MEIQNISIKDAEKLAQGIFEEEEKEDEKSKRELIESILIIIATIVIFGSLIYFTFRHRRR